jgi:ankyrin repeat protein
MFSFLFEGKLGEMLAPVMPMNQLFLAIQNHRNQEVQNFIISQQFDLRKPCEAGYMAIHVACRYNNLPAIDMLTQQGMNHSNLTLSMTYLVTV